MPTSLPYFLAIASAALYGAADFLGGLASRRANTIAIVVVSQAAGLLLLLTLLPFLPGTPASPRDALWGAAAGIAGGLGVALLYRALAVGTMALVAPMTAVCAVAVPVTGGLLLGERPSPQVVAGMALAIVAIVLVGQQQRPPAADGPAAQAPLAVRRGPPPGLVLALAAGVAIGAFFLALARTAKEAGLWPLLVARVVSIALFVAVAVVSGRSLRMARPVTLTAVAGGVLDMLSNALYLIAVREGPLSPVVTLASLYPASTVVLARLVLGERLARVQLLGIVCALVAVALIVG